MLRFAIEPLIDDGIYLLIGVSMVDAWIVFNVITRMTSMMNFIVLVECGAFVLNYVKERIR